MLKKENKKQKKANKKNKKRKKRRNWIEIFILEICPFFL